MSERPGPVPDDGPETPSLVAGFEGFRRIGSGSFSTVYAATQVQMSRPVAIKVLDAALSSASARQAFGRECRAMGVLSRHPNIVTVYSDALTHDGRACLVMELYHENYRDILTATGPLGVDELLLVGVKVAGALQAAHDTGVLHRDIKPHNVFVSDFGEPALGDFGISSIDDERTIDADSGLSVAYAAPEVIEDSDASFLSDVYSLAATLHHLAAGRPPFAGGGLEGVVRRIVSEPPPVLDRDDVPDSLRELIRRGLSKSPEERPDSAGDLAESLRDIRIEAGLDASTVPLRRVERASIRPPSAVTPPSDELSGDEEPTASETIVGGDVVDALRAAQRRRRVPDADPVRSDDVESASTSASGAPDEATVRRPRRDGVVDRPDADGADAPDRRRWTTDHVVVDVVIAAVVVALVVYAAIGLS